MASKESIAVAYVQIQPTAVGMKDSLTGLLGPDADAAGQAAGKKAGKAMGDAAAAAGKKAGAGLVEAISTGTGTAAAGLAPISGAVRGFGASAFAASRNFEEAMSSVQAITGANAAEFHELREKAIAMGAATRFSASEAAEAMTYMGMAGWNTGQILGGMQGIMDLAAASGESLGSTSDIVTDALTAFGLQAESSSDFANVLAAASTNANTNVHLLGESFKYVAPLAGSMKYNIQDTTLALGLMANAGIKGSQGGTALARVLTNLSDPSDKTAEAMKRLGIRLNDNEGNMYSLREVMGQIRESFAGVEMDISKYDQSMAALNQKLEAGKITAEEYDEQSEELAMTLLKGADAEKAQLAAAIAGRYGLSGLLAIVNASEADWNKLAGAVDNAGEKMVLTTDGAAIPLSQAIAEGIEYTQEFNGAAEAMAYIMENNLAGDMRRLDSNLETLHIRLMEEATPILRDGISLLTEVVHAFGGMSEGGRKAVLAIGGIIAISTPVLSVISGVTKSAMLFGKALGALSGAGAAAGAGASAAAAGAETAAAGAETAMVSASGLAGAFGAVATAALGVGDALLVAYDAKALGEAAETYAEAQATYATEQAVAMENYLKVYQTKGKEIADEWAMTVYQIDTTGMELGEAQMALSGRVSELWDGVPKDMWEGFRMGWGDYFGEGGGGLLALLKDSFSGALTGIRDMLGIHSPSTVFDGMGGDSATGYLQGWQKGWSPIPGMLSANARAIPGFFEGIAGQMSGHGTNAISSFGRSFLGGVSSVIGSVRSAAGRISSAFAGALGIHSPSRIFGGFGDNSISSYGNSFAAGVPAVEGKMRTAAGSLANAFGNVSLTAAADYIDTASPARGIARAMTSQGGIISGSISPATPSGRQDADLAEIVRLLRLALPQLIDKRLVIDKASLVDGLIDSIDRQLGEAAYYRQREALA